ncbi:MAG: ferritin family protein [Candidatus Omnitrophota bacterium]|nr:ferritin family protein [Candidatus Omnitrophota bacterium]MBU1929698.1 ferritin family protein [Candidatus Omnitrophota bacterium]MBU2035096.1 ferritin family protein [Candidatus Omnitrophota bacterium]MBU2221223.1 ferritin family protein [Candidatus Omnitrophota bacterium]MBU2257985.1 ferritin family protein [Candidatus Omnitrophota bacterium]
MGNILTASEIVELGIQIEKNGYDFYTEVASKSIEPKARGRFEYLAGEEKQHISVFQEILDKVDKYEPAESYTGENKDYLNALASENVFTREGKGKEIARAIDSEKKAIDMAINFEKDSINLFSVMKKAVPAQQHNIIEALIQQEQGHLVLLVEIKQTLKI